MTNLVEDLKKNIHGDVFFTTHDLLKYETDESIFKITPQVVVQPKNESDVERIVQISTHHKIPITARGGGTGVAGQSIGTGIIVDFSKHMSNILDISKNQVVVQPGVVLGNLNHIIAPQGLKFGPDPGSWDRCTIGGMIGTNAAGPHALMYGSTRDHVVDLDVVLSDGKKYESKKFPEKFIQFGNKILLKKNLIEKSKINTEKNSSGYCLSGFLDKPQSYEKLIVGSEGTLGLVTQATLNLVSIPRETYFGVFSFSLLKEALMAIECIKKTNPACVELLNKNIVSMFKKTNPALIDQLGLESAEASLWVEWNIKPPKDTLDCITFFSDSLDEIKKIWSERSKVSKLLHKLAESENRKPLRCIEDACVSIQNLIPYVDELQELLLKHDADGAIFGHVGSGHLHVNPNIRIDVPNLLGRVHSLMNEFHALVFKMGGTISGEHGDGILRSEFAKKQWKEIWPLFVEIKKIFDPNGIFNPDKKVPVVVSIWPNLKY